jgi:hypothetical protein
MMTRRVVRLEKGGAIGGWWLLASKNCEARGGGGEGGGGRWAGCRVKGDLRVEICER